MPVEGFAIVEMMGHRRVVGAVAEVEVCGQRMLQVTTLSEPPVVTQVHPQSLYALTACSREHAERAAGRDYSPLRELEAPVEAPWARAVRRDDAPRQDDDGGEEDDRLHPCRGCGAAADEPCDAGCTSGGEP